MNIYIPKKDDVIELVENCEFIIPIRTENLHMRNLLCMKGDQTVYIFPAGTKFTMVKNSSTKDYVILKYKNRNMHVHVNNINFKDFNISAVEREEMVQPKYILYKTESHGQDRIVMKYKLPNETELRELIAVRKTVYTEKKHWLTHKVKKEVKEITWVYENDQERLFYGLNDHIRQFHSEHSMCQIFPDNNI